ncbi:hypothetical protein [Jeongeupia chitinilytica]|uniref:PASTA domain-containing protein n=1 Tax=Jeongeupia chitinilytica TaxID=1041641 RepID=A0ABQ3H2D3_9NEIS|nr:hypothetical protein [Jeongeupia chitinilytica]GHD66013.1 hypothetical protein GCM10007350_27530 [Jeongeupia chitinilytica]
MRIASLVTAVLLAAPALVALPARAGNAAIELADINDQGLDFAQRTLQERGYRLVSLNDGDQVWWNQDSNTCARLKIGARARISDVENASASECRMYQRRTQASQDRPQARRRDHGGAAVELADLDHQGLSYAQREMQQRGYQLVYSNALDGRQLWWNDAAGRCADVPITGNRQIGEIRNAGRGECTSHL